MPIERSAVPWILAAILAARLACMVLVPAMDPSDARYAEFSRSTLAAGDWITPQAAQGVPFLGKPPLAFWLSAASMGLLGVHEIGARLPHLFLGLGVLWVLAILVRTESNRRDATVAVVALASMSVFYLISGSVSVNPALVLATTLAMAGFWLGAVRGRPLWGYVFFASLGLGLLAKGPIVLALTALAIGPWLLIRRQWRVPARLPWVAGTVLVLLMSLPWYVAAEIRNPGFLWYFLVGEHLQRFIHSGWAGDCYGRLTGRPYGTIWLFWLFGTLPWNLVAAWFGWHLFRERKLGSFWRSTSRGDWRVYAAGWAAAPMLLFTFSANPFWTYVMPAAPGLAVLLAELHAARPRQAPSRILAFAGIVPAILVVAVALFQLGLIEIRTEKPIVDAYRGASTGREASLYYLDELPLSAMFYSEGRAMKVSASELEPLVRQMDLFLAARELPAGLAGACRPVGTGRSLRYRLFECRKTRQH